ncbi:MAG: hypothetical protein DID89_2727546599 [Candidatus Nitrotoga sp. CP45]|nr:MAG: hypothetical protein DID89_2727546599 [Candidatus Nitrotoga sp. CP45]
MVGHKNVTLEKVVILKIKMQVVDISADKEVFYQCRNDWGNRPHTVNLHG